MKVVPPSVMVMSPVVLITLPEFGTTELSELIGPPNAGLAAKSRAATPTASGWSGG